MYGADELSVYHRAAGLPAVKRIGFDAPAFHHCIRCLPEVCIVIEMACPAVQVHGEVVVLSKHSDRGAGIGIPDLSPLVIVRGHINTIVDHNRPETQRKQDVMLFHKPLCLFNR